jgi:DNA repair protein RecO (recombination protein O)
MADADGLPGSHWVTLEAALAHANQAGQAHALRQACAATAGALRGPLRGLLHYHLGHSPLRTRQVWRGVQRLSEISTP